MNLDPRSWEIEKIHNPVLEMFLTREQFKLLIHENLLILCSFKNSKDIFIVFFIGVNLQKCGEL